MTFGRPSKECTTGLALTARDDAYVAVHAEGRGESGQAIVVHVVAQPS